MPNINIRVRPNQERFVEWLDRLEKGTHRAEDVPRADRHRIIPLRDWFVVPTLEVARVFGDLRADVVPNKAILTFFNANCHVTNQMIVENVGGGLQRIYLSADCVENEDQADNFTVEFLNFLDPFGFPQHRLAVKEGCVAMLLKNLNVRDNLCNGTRLLVRRLGENYVGAEWIELDGCPYGRIAFIPRGDFLTDNDITLPFRLRCPQFPAV